MSKITVGENRWRWRRTVAALLVVTLPAFVVACSGTAGDLFGKQDGPDDISADYFTTPAYCPPVRIRGDTESFIVYERGHEAEPEYIRYQATITKTARECRAAANGFTVKVGVAGRVVAGPKGGQGSVTVPIRVVLTQQSGGVVFSKLYKIPIAITPPALGTNFSQVVEEIPVTALPSDRDFLIYVGFDDGKAG